MSHWTFKSPALGEDVCGLDCVLDEIKNLKAENSELRTRINKLEVSFIQTGSN